MYWVMLINQELFYPYSAFSIYVESWGLQKQALCSDGANGWGWTMPTHKWCRQPGGNNPMALIGWSMHVKWFYVRLEPGRVEMPKHSIKQVNPSVPVQYVNTWFGVDPASHLMVQCHCVWGGGYVDSAQTCVLKVHTHGEKIRPLDRQDLQGHIISR